MIKFIVYGEPFGKLNMRPTLIGGHASSYSPIQNKDYMSKVQFSFIQAASYKDEETHLNFDDPIKMTIVAYKGIPKSVSKKKSTKMLCGEIRPTTKPDCDNISKVVCDALNKLAFKDDSQIIELNVKKYYSDCPRIIVELENI